MFGTRSSSEKLACDCRGSSCFKHEGLGIGFSEIAEQVRFTRASNVIVGLGDGFGRGEVEPCEDAMEFRLRDCDLR